MRQLAPVAVVLALTGAGFAGARVLGARDARLDSERQAAVAAAQVRARVEQGVSLLESLRQSVVGVPGRGATGEAFTANAALWLSPAGIPAAAWVEQVAASEREAYERRTATIVTPGLTRAPRRASHLPATLVSGVVPFNQPGLDLAGEPGMTAALARASRLYGAGATPLLTLRDGTRGLFLVERAPRLAGGLIRPGFVVVFVPELWLHEGAPDARRLTVGSAPQANGEVVHSAFTGAGQRFDVAVPLRDVGGAAAALPWIIVAAGLVLAGLAAALAVNAERRTRAQDELDRIFTLSPDLIVIADFDGYFTRVNPAVERVLGYSEAELLTRPFLEFVHADDRERSVAELGRLAQGHRTLSFVNRFVCKDGSFRVLEWTAMPIVEGRALYGIGRDITERARLTSEQAALRRVATLVAKGVPPGDVFAAVAEEVRQLLGAQVTQIGRLEPDGRRMLVVASNGSAATPVGSPVELEPNIAFTRVVQTGRSARVDDFSGAPEHIRERARQMRIDSAVAVPIVVEGALWGAVMAGTARERFPEDAEQRMAEFTALAGTAIANAESRSELTASRARVVAASDEARRRIERDLHDGAQQRLVSAVMTLKLARLAIREGDHEAPELVDQALDYTERATAELRELAQGILPVSLRRAGLSVAIEALAARMPLPVATAIDAGRFPPALEATAYFVVAEALTNVVKHAEATRASVAIRVRDRTLLIEIDDDGVGGADAAGTGFVGLADRLAVLDGTLTVESPPGAGTSVRAEIPLG